MALILAAAWHVADRIAEKAFWKATAAAIGFQPFTELGELQMTTPLLHAGDRRVFRHELKGPLGELGLPAKLAHYRYDVRHEDKDGKDTWRHYRFTICAVELEAGMELFQGVYLRERRGLLARGQHDWLRGRGLREVELESSDFNDAYDLRVSPEQDPAGCASCSIRRRSSGWPTTRCARTSSSGPASSSSTSPATSRTSAGWCGCSRPPSASRAACARRSPRRSHRLRPCAFVAPLVAALGLLLATGRRSVAAADARAVARRTRRSADGSAQRRLDQAAAAGGGAGIHNYRFRPRSICFCVRREPVVRVRPQTTARSTHRASCATWPPSAACTASSSARSAAGCASSRSSTTAAASRAGS